MKRLFALLGTVSFLTAGTALADTTVQTNSYPGSSSTTVTHEGPAPAEIVQPAPNITTNKYKVKKHGLFGKTKVKGETTTVTP